MDLALLKRVTSYNRTDKIDFFTSILQDQVTNEINALS